MPKKVSTDETYEKRVGDYGVYYEKSLTKNMGNYESARVTVGVKLPIEPTSKEIGLIKETILKADEIVTAELEVQLKELISSK